MTSMRVNAERFARDFTLCATRFLFAVCVAGVGVAAVADDRLCAAVRDIFACDKNRRTLYKVLRVNAYRRTVFC